MRDGPPGGLAVRQHPKTGFFVEGLTLTAVSSYSEVGACCAALPSHAQVERRMAQGTLNRTTASTLMNETSSRSHMVVLIKCKQVRWRAVAEYTRPVADR